MSSGIIGAGTDTTLQAGRAARPYEHRTAHNEHLLSLLAADHAKPLLAYVERILSDRHMAEDIVQETLIRAWHRSEQLLDNDGSLRGWLVTVARHLAIDRIRSAYARHESPGSEHREVIQNDHADAVSASIDTMALLRQLSPEHQDVLVHTYLHDRSVLETARILGIPAGTVKSRQHYALRRLRNRVPTRTAAEPATGAAAASGRVPAPRGIPSPPRTGSPLAR
ncbi:sigma-70 family RNA polymerase sigma factor [Streptomyces sp. NBC_00728]|jgi:RNA polymerase sigma factor, sigma-70 family|uniref:sigma-70 family RNA polymerase sigma factor n=1 Tax=Streptomyces sp. NBC_00728 TaxID=2903676 RepID=UPI00386BAF11